MQNDHSRYNTRGRVLAVSHAIAYSTNASRGLSAIAEFLVIIISIEAATS